MKLFRQQLRHITHRIILYFPPCLILLIGYLFIPEQALTASFYQCDFEAGNCLQEIYNNKIDTFANFGITILPQGGSYGVTAKSTKGVEGADGVQGYYNINSVYELYVRVYVYFPIGYTSRSTPAGSLKFLRTNDPNYPSDDNDFMLFEENGLLKLRKSALLKPYTGTPYWGPTFPTNGITRGNWHYVEFHYKSQSGNDVVQAWVDADARTQPPTWQETGVNIYEYSFEQLHFNINWSGIGAPATQQFYLDGIETATTPIGDTYQLLGSDIMPPSPPTGLRIW